MCRSREMVHSSEIQGCNLLEYGIRVLYIRLHGIGIVSWSVPQIKPISHSLTQPSYHAFKKNKTNDWVFSKRMKRMTCVRIASYCIIHQSYWLLVLGWRWLGRILLISNPPRWSSIELNIFIGAKFTATVAPFCTWEEATQHKQMSEEEDLPGGTSCMWWKLMSYHKLQQSMNSNTTTAGTYTVSAFPDFWYDLFQFLNLNWGMPWSLFEAFFNLDLLAVSSFAWGWGVLFGIHHTKVVL